MLTFTVKLKNHPFNYQDPTTKARLTFNADVIAYRDGTHEISAYNYKTSRPLPSHMLNSLISKAVVHTSNQLNANYYKAIRS